MTIAKLLTTGAVAAFLSASGASANTVTLAFDLNSSSTNDPATLATGTAELSFSDAGDDLLIDVLVTNTSVVASELISFGFDLIGSFVSFTAGSVLDNNLTPGGFPGNIDVTFCATSQTTCTSGGQPNGLSQGEFDTFSVLTDTDLTAATAAAAYSSLFFDGQPFSTGANSDPTAVLRFLSVAGGGAGSETRFNPSDGGLTPVPLPAAGWMLLAGVGGMAAFKRRKQNA